ncbi:hypothetical protein OXYTRIMIC_221 [Oxytricha trifallax]|uniref:Uncharacterized protein n=1 Tax=Oxytricha trifallax TaxID=1172189 RepID=A0A073HYQ2_9SPIT|nr:hypothetical protein OXYTRIMIC_221 [Oxytricha trifallax]
MNGEVSEVEGNMFNSQQHKFDIVSDAEQKGHASTQEEGMKGNVTIRPREKKAEEEVNGHEVKRMNNMETQ